MTANRETASHSPPSAPKPPPSHPIDSEREALAAQVQMLQAQLDRMNQPTAPPLQSMENCQPLQTAPTGKSADLAELEQLRETVQHYKSQDWSSFPSGPDVSIQDGVMFEQSTNASDKIMHDMLPAGSSPELERVLKNLIPDVTTITAGTFQSDTLSNESELLTLLGKTIHGAASELSHVDTGYPRRKDMLAKIKTRKDLDEFDELLDNIIFQTLPVFQKRLEQTLIRHNFAPAYAEAFALSSRLATWVKSFFDLWQKMLRYFVNQANKTGFDATKEEINHHAKKLSMFRSTAADRFHLLAQTYTYLRNASQRKYHDEAVAQIRIEYRLAELHDLASATAPAKSTPATTTSSTAAPSTSSTQCSWCSGKHSGGKAACPFGDPSLSIKRSTVVKLAARVEKRGGDFGRVGKAVLAEYLEESEKDRERTKEREKEKKSGAD
jgi:hypothetical protein